MYRIRICKIVFLLVLSLTLGVFLAACGQKAPSEGNLGKNSESGEVILATTTSTQDSGLLDVLIPIFEQKTGYKVKIIPVGTGQALAMGEKGNADVMLVHAPEDEIELVEKGAAINRRLVMHNDFVIVGPAEDPAGIKNAKDAAEAFKLIAEKEALFISRGDNSGTHKKELDIWKKAGIENPSGKWYQSTGQGMGATLDVASEKSGYTLTDRATYLAKKDKLHLVILKEKDGSLINIYHVMQANPDYVKQSNPDAAGMINVEGARAFVEFMVAPETQKIIGEFGKDKFGQPLFIPDAGKSEDNILE
ncbi:substrate-binding domain-containing protein [Thermosediminibacter oceani]|uniref:Extracellular solute-binding protein n=1 Tax=Thermosediminibacter oceani (strain ATCC BAA-1034 / DSM 16646 / JW/IW-1228P) TaxID=555079 RepID=D9S053_THEOJ|nr:substrate-binding domain-containing protein [Thermosediminibacter oceani]ADL06981.1 extracellular solute-binding protein [Thermosediminibacter oceani DSM 16646]